MKKRLQGIWQYLPWLLLLLGLDVFAGLLLWLADTDAFRAVLAVLVLATVLLFLVVCTVLLQGEEKRRQACLDFLENPEEAQETRFVKKAPPDWREPAAILGEDLRNRDEKLRSLEEQVRDYEEYVEAWAHETKTPLSLLTLILDNRREELSPQMAFRLDYIRSRPQESVDQMLFYARMKSVRKDYYLERLRIRECAEEVLLDYRPLLEEKGFQVQNFLSGETVYADRRGLRFLLGQIISNAIKYSKEKPVLELSGFQEEGRWVLSIRDNGAGVPGCDLPYIFEKGFTGDVGGGRKKATGMGLYLAKGIAGEMNLALEADSVLGEGFEMKILFPCVHEKEQEPG